MTEHRNLYQAIKVKLNTALDRVIDVCNMILMDAYQFPWAPGQNIAKGLAKVVGNLSWSLHAFPRLSTYKLIGPQWTLVFVGGEEGLVVMCDLFFPEDDMEQQELGRTAIWQLGTRTEAWLKSDVDLVICELGQAQRVPKGSVVTFNVPTWIHQVVDIPTPLSLLAKGSKGRRVRKKLNRIRRVGFSYRFSQDDADFDNFHYTMYRPYISERHGERALLARYEDQKQRWFKRGGLILALKDEQPVGGLLSYMANSTCFFVELGILEASPELMYQGITTFLYWSAMEWGQAQGAKIFEMGGTRPWTSNGIFEFKQTWGARVTKRKRIYGKWVFQARELSAPLRQFINDQGFISEINDGFYNVFITDGTHNTETTALEADLNTAQKMGLTGVAYVSPGTEMVCQKVEKQNALESN